MSAEAPLATEYDHQYAYYQDTGLAPRFSSAWWSARFYTRVLRSYIPRGAVLDYGCGMGNLLRELERSYSAWGVDISSFGVEAARQNTVTSRVWVGDLSSLRPQPEGRFDAIVSKHVLEHVPDPAAAIRTFASLLRPGGIFLMGVPNTSSLLRGLKGDQWIGTKDPTHCSLLSPAEWVHAAEDAGLQIVRTFSDGWWDVPYVPFIPPALQLPIFGCLAIVQVLIGRPFIPVPLGESFIMVARRPNTSTSQRSNAR